MAARYCQLFVRAMRRTSVEGHHVSGWQKKPFEAKRGTNIATVYAGVYGQSSGEDVIGPPYPMRKRPWKCLDALATARQARY